MDSLLLNMKIILSRSVNRNYIILIEYLIDKERKMIK